MELRVAALYDVHGNFPALEAVLADVKSARVDAIVFGGDIVWGAWPQETLDLALAAGDHFVMGNTDRSVLDLRGASARWAFERLTPEQREFVARWPATVTLDVAGLGPTLFCHATPGSDMAVVTPASSEERWAFMLDGVEERTVVCGHTHLQYDEPHAGHRIVNPGSVGDPTERATAWWALLGPDVELRTTDYDTRATAAAWRATGFPRTDFADGLEAPPARDEVLALLEGFANPTLLFGGAFDPPHAGHVAVVETAKRHFGVPVATILVAEHPGHKETYAPADVRLALARAAFPRDDVRLDRHARTVDLLQAEPFKDPIFVIGADQLADFPSWKDPDGVLERTRLAVATRPGYPREDLEAVLRGLKRPERVVFFDLDPNSTASTDVRARAEAGEPLAGLVPDAVAALIEEQGLYRRD